MRGLNEMSSTHLTQIYVQRTAAEKRQQYDSDKSQFGYSKAQEFTF